MIRSASLDDVAAACHGMLLGKNVMFDSVSIDSRTLKEGDLFVAIRGDTFDGHEFISQAVASGCCGVVSEEDVETGAPTILVKDSTVALGEIARTNREMFDGLVIGMTGSTGKTTTKNMLASILSIQGATCSTEGNFNNEIGVPLTLLSLNSSHKYAVVEMGARSKGDIRYLGRLVQPEIAMLLNAGYAHIDIFGSHENIVSAKGEIFDELKSDGYAVLNADDPAASVWLKQLKGKKTLKFSVLTNEADVWAENIDCSADVSTYTLRTKDCLQNIYLPVPGYHNVVNSLAAATAAIAAGVELSAISEGLNAIKNDTGRLQVIHLPYDIVVIDDSYNANPASVCAALDVLSLREGEKTAVLGEMAELGDAAAQMHKNVAEYAASKSIDSFYLIGPFAHDMAACIGDRAKIFSSKIVLANQLCDDLVTGESILIKGSRIAAMEEIIEVMKGRAH